MGKGSAEFFKMNPQKEEEQKALKVFEVLKKTEGISVKDIPGETGLSEGDVASYIDACAGRDLVKVSGEGDQRLIRFNDGYGRLLGIGFSNEKCVLSVLDIAGKVQSSEMIDIDPLSGFKGKKKEVKKLIEKISDQTKLSGETYSAVGIALPAVLVKKNPDSAILLSEGIKGIFPAGILFSGESTAAGYAERDLGMGTVGKDFIYMHSDVGSGVAIKNDVVFEAGVGGIDNDAYLRPWNQFSIVDLAKDLISKGLGTDIVGLADGDLDNVTLDTVFKAAENNDELAEDLVKRSALALGVRVAYLANMFDPEVVILGGGIEKQEGRFIQYVQESLKKFILKEVGGRIAVSPGVLGKKASSIGAALLCRRELFMGV